MGVKQIARVPTEPHAAVPDLLRPTAVLRSEENCLLAVLRSEENCLLEAHIAELELKADPLQVLTERIRHRALRRD